MSVIFERRLPSIKLNVLIYKDNNDWTAVCLQMDLVASNNSVDAAIDDITDLIRTQVIYALDNDNMDNIFKSAPHEEWAKLKDAKKCGSRRIMIELPEKESRAKTSAVREVELCLV